MKKKEFISIKNLSIKELTEKAKLAEKEINNHVMDKNMKKLKNVKMISKKRKEVAQFLTLIKQKEMLAQLEAKK
ncbi:MAG: 50S ribosomal protein L29 [Candidatus Daviesbacteria bacterium]|nr:50S ribosomal protein L29 [Candidatus Daviesbacteria bacterium]